MTRLARPLFVRSLTVLRCAAWCLTYTGRVFSVVLQCIDFVFIWVMGLRRIPACLRFCCQCDTGEPSSHDGTTAMRYGGEWSPRV